MKFKKIIRSKIFKTILGLLIIFLVVWFWPARNNSSINYGATFSAKYARELHLDPKEVFEAMLRDLKIKKIRLVAYWSDIEIVRGERNFADLDWQIKLAQENNVEIILALGRRVPRWPECHIPGWASAIPQEERDIALKEFIIAVITHYKDDENIVAWQVENEAFFTVYASHFCGNSANKDLIDEEIEIVRQIDPIRPIIMTDSGNLGLWGSAYKRADIFGSTFYVYLMHDGELRTPLTHNFYKLKRAFWGLIYGQKETMLIEISVEPYLTKNMYDVSLGELVDRLSIDRVKSIIEFAHHTGFSQQYLWGIEWHYYMKENGYPEYWDYMKEVFGKD